MTEFILDGLHTHKEVVELLNTPKSKEFIRNYIGNPRDHSMVATSKAVETSKATALPTILDDHSQFTFLAQKLQEAARRNDLHAVKRIKSKIEKIREKYE